MSMTIGAHTFDRVTYDKGGDVLYLHKGNALSDADWDETPEGHGLSFDAAGELVGVTIVSPRHILERRGKLTITLPQPLEIGAQALDDALLAA
jgi:uncharacterized protein YuzE